MDRIAAGDYPVHESGFQSPKLSLLAALIHGWQPEIVITVGDKNYPSGAADTLDANIGNYFHDYIYPYTGSYNANFGALRVTASETEMLFEFYNRVGELIDLYRVTKP
jgi:hypothetical protein